MSVVGGRIAGTTADFLPELQLGLDNLRAHKLRSLLTMLGMIIGVALNGVVFDPGTAEFWRDDPSLGWRMEAIGGPRNLGLDRLRQSGWRGSGYVRWRHETNRGFLRALDGLREQAAAIGEADEAERCAMFLHQLDPDWDRRGAAGPGGAGPLGPGAGGRARPRTLSGRRFMSDELLPGPAAEAPRAARDNPADHLNAAQALERAAELTADPADAAAYRVRAARRAWRAGRPHQARILLQRVRAEPTQEHVVAERELLLGEIELRVGVATNARNTLLAAATMTLSSVFVVCNSLRLRRFSVPAAPVTPEPR